MDVIANYEMLEQCARSGQMSAEQLQAEFAAEPAFAAWFRNRREADDTTTTSALEARVDDLTGRLVWFEHLASLRGDLLKEQSAKLRERNEQYDMLCQRCAEQAKELTSLILKLRDEEAEIAPNPIFSAVGAMQQQGIR